MKHTIFYLWQSDLPNATNREFIQTALERAVKALAIDDALNVQPVIERDTQGNPGAPDENAPTMCCSAEPVGVA